MSIGRIVTIPIGVLLIVVGIIIWFTANTAIHNKVENSSIILPENDKSEAVNPYSRFVSNIDDENNQRIYEFYVYNLTNPEEVKTGSFPIYEELGPYQYQYFYKKINMSIDDDNVITYQNWKYYVPILDNYNARDSSKDVVYHFNLAYAGVVENLPYPSGEIALYYTMSVTGGINIRNTIPLLSQKVNNFSLIPYINTYWTLLVEESGSLEQAGSLWITEIPDAYKKLIPPNFICDKCELLIDFVDVLYYLFDSNEVSSFTHPLDPTKEGVAWDFPSGTREYDILYIAYSDYFGAESFPEVYTWYHNFKDTFSFSLCLLTESCQGNYTCTPDDVDAIQFGTTSGYLNGVSVTSVSNGTLQFQPEYGISTGKNLSIPIVKLLWDTSSSISILTIKGIGKLIDLIDAGDSEGLTEASNGLIDLVTAQDIKVYLTNMTYLYGFDGIQRDNGGPITSHIVNDFLFQTQDPLLKIFNPNDPTKWNSAPFRNYTTEEIATKFLPFEKVYTGKNDPLLSQVPITFKGNETLSYAVPIQVQGHSTENIGPYYITDSGVQDPPVTLFSEDYGRPLLMDRETVGSIDGLRYYRYRMSKENWKVNETVFTSIEYLMNLTTVSGVPASVSRPRMKGMHPGYLTKAGLSYNAYKDLDNDNDVYGDYEPITGKAIRGRYSLQINYYVPGNDKGISPYYDVFTQLRGDVVHPIVWCKSEISANEKQLKNIRSSYKVDSFRYAITIILFVVGSVLVLCVAGLYLIDSLEARGFFMQL